MKSLEQLEREAWLEVKHLTVFPRKTRKHMATTLAFERLSALRDERRRLLGLSLPGERPLIVPP